MSGDVVGISKGTALRPYRALRLLVSVLVILPAGLAANSPVARGQASDQYSPAGWFTDQNGTPPSASGSRPNVFQVTATVHNTMITCQGERVHAFEVGLSGDPVVVSGIMQGVRTLNEAADSVCTSDLYAMLGTAQQALVIQQIRVADSCIQDAESALFDGDSQTGSSRLWAAVKSFQVAGQMLVPGAERALVVGERGDAAKQVLDSGLQTLGLVGRGVSGINGLIENAAAHHLLKDMAQDFADDRVVDATLDASNLDGRVANVLAADYDAKVNRNLTGWLRSYKCP